MVRSKSARRAVLGGIAAAGVMSAAIAQISVPEAIETTQLATDAFSTGTLEPSNGALPSTLWANSDPQTLEFLLANAPTQLSAPSLGEAMRRALLSPGAAPIGAQPSLGGKKLLALARAGFFEEARNVASLSSAGRGDPWAGQAHAVADLLTDDIGAACRRNANLNSGREEIFWVRLRVLCYAQAGERDAADLTLNLLREQGALSESDETFLSAAAAGAPFKTPVAARSALHYAIARMMEMPIAPGLLEGADGGVLVALAKDEKADLASRIDAAARAIAMGVLGADELANIFLREQFSPEELAAATSAAQRNDQATDALLYQSIKSMTAPEFIRDKAQRLALALSRADSFHRAYALSVLYADEIRSLEGVLATPEEALLFSMARMADGDSVGAGQWLMTALDANGSVAALPEAVALKVIEQVQYLSILDPETAIRIARAANVSLLSRPASEAGGHDHDDPTAMVRIIEAAFDAAVDRKPGQAALAALAVSRDAQNDVDTVVISQSLRAAGLSELSRRHAFETAWARAFANNADANAQPSSDEEGFSPRVKPSRP